ncbi:MAG: hypothetical protein GXO66_07670 [Euryarchaeota archaeon]|nr:hypothetical protein [Euryarchaeota archaeon]
MRALPLAFLCLLLSCPPAAGYTQAEFDAANATVASAQDGIAQVEAILDASPAIKDDLEVNLKLDEARIKLNTSLSYLTAAVDTNASNPDLATTFLDFATASATEAGSLAETARTLAIAKNLSAAASQAELKRLIESISSDMSRFATGSQELQAELDSLSLSIQELKSKGTSVTTAEERYREAQILYRHALELYNSSRKSFDQGDHEAAQATITEALKELQSAQIKADSAGSFLGLAASDITSQEEEVSRLLNTTKARLDASSAQMETALAVLALLEDSGLSLENFKKLLNSNAQHLNSASEYYDKALFRKNFLDYGQSREFSLLALEELNNFQSRQEEFLDSLLVLLAPRVDEDYNQTLARLQVAEASYRREMEGLDEPHLSLADEALSQTKLALSDALRKKTAGKEQWDAGNYSLATRYYLDSEAAMEAGNNSLSSLEALVSSVEEMAALEANLAALDDLSGGRFSGITPEELEELRQAHRQALALFQAQDYQASMERLKASNLRAEEMIEKAEKTATSFKRAAWLVGYSLFLLAVMALIELHGRLRG